MARPRPFTLSKVVQPYSLILEQKEINALRKIASKESISVGALIRRAIHTAIYRVHPELINQMLEADVDAFLGQLAQKYPASILTSAKRRAFKKRLVRELV